MSGDHNRYQKPDKQCQRCGEVNPAEIHTCTPKQAYPENFIDALRYYTAISEKPEQEPVMCDCDSPTWCKQYKKCHRAMLGFEPYVAPPQREWQGLTAKDLAEIPPNCYEGAIWADAKLKEKNGG